MVNISGNQTLANWWIDFVRPEFNTLFPPERYKQLVDACECPIPFNSVMELCIPYARLISSFLDLESASVSQTPSETV